MPQINPWHSAKENAHHNNTMCTMTQKTPATTQQRGTGNKPLCPECRKLKILGK